MRCEKCNVEILCKAEVCPLCHLPVSGGVNLEAAFPARAPKRGLRQIPFTKLYALIAFSLIVFAIILNLIFARGSYYWIIVAGGLMYLYFCIRSTVLSYKHFNMKIFGQTAALTIMGIILESVFKVELYIFSIVLPLIYLIAIIVVFINIMSNINNARSYLVSFLLIAILGIIPFIAVLVEKITLWPSLIVAITSAITLILLSIIARKKLADEFTRIFHR
ncbi:MAG: hypothetical protein EOM87_05570 [Clostridia bacterium]|nr:hypothetical protein [Clostridia bacterium]